MRALWVLDRCRNAAEDIEEITRQVARRKDILKSGENEAIAKELAELNKALTARKKEMRAEVSAVTAMLDMLPGVTGEVMHRFYIKRESYNTISRAMNYSVSYIRKCVGTGRKKLARLQHADMLKLLPASYIEKYNQEAM